MSDFVPRKGDLIALPFSPTAGHEQRGRRPALVISNDEFNRRVGLCVACPVTSTRRENPFHVALPEAGPVTGHVMVEQVRSIDYRARGVRRIDTVPDSVLEQVLATLDAVLY